MGEASHSTNLQRMLDLLQAGDDSARTPLVEHSVERFRVLARKMLRRNNDLRSLDETDDVLQKALLRLHRALATVKPPDVRSYVGLAAKHIRWVLYDLAREANAARGRAHTGPNPLVRDTEQDEPEDRAGEPSNLLEWSDLHAKIEALPHDEREMFDLLFYQELTQPEAAEVLKTSLRTVKRRWQSARLRLREALRSEWPSLEGDRP